MGVTSVQEAWPVPIYCLTITYKSATVEERERVMLTTTQQSTLLTQVANGHLSSVSELVILSTCNRIELYAHRSQPDGCAVLFEQWSCLSGFDLTRLGNLTTVLEDQAAVRHLFEVSSGLDSQVVGEPQILGQVATAFERALEHRAAGILLSTLMQHAIQVGKRVRAETSLGVGSLSIGAVIAAHSTKMLGDLSALTVLIVGTGEMARTVTSALSHRTIGKLLITNHNALHAEHVAAEFGAQTVPYTQLRQALTQVDLIVTAVSAPEPILYADDLRTITRSRSGCPLLIFDIGLPRNVDPAASSVSGIQLYNLDDLQTVSDTHYGVRQAAIPEAHTIIDEQIEAFRRWQQARTAVPTIQRLRGKAESIRQSELALALRRLPDMDARTRAVFIEMSQRLTNKLIDQPTRILKERTDSDKSATYINVLQDLFGLGTSDNVPDGER